MRICRLCDAELKDGKYKCTSCGSWNTEDTIKEKVSINGEDADGSITLDKVKAEDAARIFTGPWDFCWGGGIVQTSTTLIGGSPGAGKTTLLLSIGSSICSKIEKPDVVYEKGEGQVIYLAAEQSLPEIQITAVRLELKHSKNIRMVPAMGGYANIGSILANRKPRFVVLDSLQGLTGDDNGAQLAVLDILKKIAVDLKCPVVVIMRVTKDGELAGLNELQHHVDTTMSLFPDDIELIDRPDAETKARIMEVKKNRFGRAHISQAFAMTEKGLVYVPNYDELLEDKIEDEDED